MFLARLVLRRTWAAVVVVLGIALSLGLVWLNSGVPLSLVAGVTVMQMTAVLLLIRFGILAGLGYVFVGGLLGNLPITNDLGAWYASATWLALFVIFALAAYSFRCALAGRPLFGEGLLKE